MPVWFEGKNEIECSINEVIGDIKSIEEHFVKVTKHMPGLTSVELVESGDGFVTIKTNEGLMKRTNILVNTTKNDARIEFDEEYQGGKLITNKYHIAFEFTGNGDTVEQHLVISDQKSSGVLGFMYSKFAKSNIGKAFLNSYKSYFEKN